MSTFPKLSVKIINDQEKVDRYTKIIRDENKRMNTQVENVLRISRLDNNQLDIRKEHVDMHDILKEAIHHVQLIVDSRQGYICSKLDAIERSVNINISHFTNVLTNILDNAVKYSNDAPKIDINTYIMLHLQLLDPDLKQRRGSGFKMKYFRLVNIFI